MKNNWKKATLPSEKESHIDPVCISVTSMSRKWPTLEAKYEAISGRTGLSMKNRILPIRFLEDAKDTQLITFEC